MWGWFQKKSTKASVDDLSGGPEEHFFQVKASVLSDRGVREANEDSVCVLTHPQAHLRSVRMVGLADGMGGHAAGEIASRTCLQACTEHLEQSTQSLSDGLLTQALQEANRRVWFQSHERSEYTGMGTTLCLLAFEGDHYRYAWVGDSRIYRLRDGTLMPLTRDDTVVNALLDQGVLSAEEALRHPERHVLCQALGTAPELEKPHVSEAEPLQDGDLFLLTSDGVHDALPVTTIATLLGSDIHACAQRLIEQAKQAGSQDNLSAVVVQVQRKALAEAERHLQPGKATTLETQPCA